MRQVFRDTCWGQPFETKQPWKYCRLKRTITGEEPSHTKNAKKAASAQSWRASIWLNANRYRCCWKQDKGHQHQDRKWGINKGHEGRVQWKLHMGTFPHGSIPQLGTVDRQEEALVCREVPLWRINHTGVWWSHCMGKGWLVAHRWLQFKQLLPDNQWGPEGGLGTLACQHPSRGL